MGGARSESGQRANEFIRQIELKRPFYVASHELTQRQFYGRGSNLPLVNIAWDKVAIYCNKLSQKEGFSPFYKTQNGSVIGFHTDSDGYRLISEAEWEFLARAHKRSRQTIFPWGNDAVAPPKSGNLAGEKAKSASKSYIAGYQDGFSASAPPKSFPADQSGLYDIVGNVSEWTNDSYSFEPPSSGNIETDPLGHYKSGAHVIKGSNFNSASRTELRSAFREGGDAPRNDVGFRLARYL
jgi:formylglycine-generating enzyme required for sulfatase activity